MPQKILIVDDDQTIRKIGEYNLKKAGYEVITANNGEEGIRKIETEKPDLVILDLMMPVMDGYEVCQKIKEDWLRSHIPIIILSIKKDVDDKVKGLRVGADDYLAKPFDPQELLVRVEANLRRIKRDMQANPLTGLPGNVPINNKITEVIKQGRSFCILYIDLDYFKAFNDTYGYERGDEVIQFTSQTIIQTIRELGNSTDFVGHIGGDDFVVLTTPTKVDSICNEIIKAFDIGILNFYDEEDRERGFLLCPDRKGQPNKFPLISISIACVTNEQNKFTHLGEISAAAAEMKKYAKSIAGSSYVKDRRKMLNFKTTAKLENLPLMSNFINQATQKFGLDKDTGFDIQVAVEEACENIVEHSYPKGSEGSIEINCEYKDNNFIVKIKDYGQSFDPNTIPEPNLEAKLEDRTTGGLGIYFMKRLMDEINYYFDPKEGNELIMVKRLNAKR
ncbi:MAG: response regulator [bacterium]